MIHTIAKTRPDSQQWTIRIAGIAIFTLLTAIGAQVEIWFGGPVPFTLQVLVVLLAGMVLGSKEGAASQLLYAGLIVLNLPIAAGGAGASALSSATAGYIIGFIPSAFITGWLVEKGANRVGLRWLAGIVGVFVIYLFGVPVLYSVAGADSWAQAIEWGATPFIGLDMLKALIAASLAEGGRRVLSQYLVPMPKNQASQ